MVVTMNASINIRYKGFAKRRLLMLLSNIPNASPKAKAKSGVRKNPSPAYATIAHLTPAKIKYTVKNGIYIGAEYI